MQGARSNRSLSLPYMNLNFIPTKTMFLEGQHGYRTGSVRMFFLASSANRLQRIYINKQKLFIWLSTKNFTPSSTFQYSIASIYQRQVNDTYEAVGLKDKIVMAIIRNDKETLRKAIQQLEDQSGDLSFIMEKKKANATLP